MKQDYISPELQVLSFENKNLICTSFQSRQIDDIDGELNW